MELKSPCLAFTPAETRCSNRTFMELKSDLSKEALGDVQF